MEREKGYIMIPVLFVLAMLFILITASTEAFVTEKQFSKEIRSKLVTNYMLRAAIYDSLDQLGPDCRAGEGGTLVYLQGEVRFNVFERTENIIKIQLKGYSNLKGKAEMQFEYSLPDDKVIIYY